MGAIDVQEYQGNENILCPYCGNEWWLEDCENACFELTGVEKCPECGMKFTYLLDYVPTITSYTYKGRTKRKVADQYDNTCQMCEKPLKQGVEYPVCPVCGFIACDECERKKRPCCKQYMRWVFDEKAEKS